MEGSLPGLEREQGTREIAQQENVYAAKREVGTAESHGAYKPGVPNTARKAKQTPS